MLALLIWVSWSSKNRGLLTDEALKEIDNSERWDNMTKKIIYQVPILPEYVLLNLHICLLFV